MPLRRGVVGLINGHYHFTSRTITTTNKKENENDKLYKTLTVYNYKKP